MYLYEISETTDLYILGAEEYDPATCFPGVTPMSYLWGENMYTSDTASIYDTDATITTETFNYQDNPLWGLYRAFLVYMRYSVGEDDFDTANA
jgi:hypothetical protein